MMPKPRVRVPMGEPKPDDELIVRTDLTDLATAAAVAEADIDNAIAQWRRDAPPELADLLDAGSILGGEDRDGRPGRR